MRYLIAQAQSSHEFSKDEIFVIPVREELVNTVHKYSDKIYGQIECVSLQRNEELYGFRVPADCWPLQELNSLKSFRTFLQNELAQSEFALIDESAAINEEVLRDMTDPFVLGINVFASSTAFNHSIRDYIEYTTYQIPLTCLPLSTKIGTPGNN